MSKAVLRVAVPCDRKTVKSIISGFEQLLVKKLDFQVIEDNTLLGGFIAMIDGQMYDSSIRLDSIKSPDNKEESEANADISPVSICGYIRERIAKLDTSAQVYMFGTVISCADDIVHIDGLPGVCYGELLEFDCGAYALALDLGLEETGAVLLDGSTTVQTGSIARRTGHVADICVGDALLGRIIDPIGRPLDGKPLECNEFRPIEASSPTIMERSPVSKPLETGILAIDSMIPIGRGQRELIIGDRQTGKTSIALSAILNQNDTDVICVYCSIGQKPVNVANIANKLGTGGALKHTVIVSSFSSDSAAMQYLAPYAACAIAEKFMYDGKDVLIVYDDLSKHATSYRTMSLLLRRPSGREAYPGDVFYLHSRLLERSAQLSAKLGGGSMTALPIVETLAGDISAYIPTNVISITDGQIYLETELFNSGVRPAINVGLSVSRVGRSAQSKAMKKVSSSLRLEVAQCRDMAIFAQFGAEVDPATAAMIENGNRLTELLIQPVGTLYKLSEQVCILLASKAGIFSNTPVKQVREMMGHLLEYMWHSAGSAMREIDSTGNLSEQREKDMRTAMERFRISESNSESVV